VRIDLSEAALRDIQNIRRYTLRQWGSLQEEKYLNPNPAFEVNFPS